MGCVGAFFFTSCATKYGPEGFFSGGFSEIVYAPDHFVVTFRGNEYTSYEQELKYALKRVSELTLNHGYSYFEIVEVKDRYQEVSYSNTKEKGTMNQIMLDILKTTISSSSDKEKKEGQEEEKKVNYATEKLSESGKKITSSLVKVCVKCYQAKPKEIEVIDAAFYISRN